MTTEQHTPRGALIAFANYLVERKTQFSSASVYALLAREFAEEYPDEPAPEKFTAELASTPQLDVDQRLRVDALRCAAMLHAEYAEYAERVDNHAGMVVADADMFEDYLREGL